MLKFRGIEIRLIRAGYRIGVRADEIKRTAVTTVRLSRSSCAFSNADITTRGRADQPRWLYSQTLGHCRPKIPADTLGSCLDTSRLVLSQTYCSPSPHQSHQEGSDTCPDSETNLPTCWFVSWKMLDSVSVPFWCLYEMKHLSKCCSDVLFRGWTHLIPEIFIMISPHLLKVLAPGSVIF